MAPIDVVIKAVEPVRVASIRETLPDYPAVGALFGELEGAIAQQHQPQSTTYLSIWHDEDYKERDVDGEAAIGVAASFEGNDRVKVYDLPGWKTCACLVYSGAYNAMMAPYQNLMGWIEANGYRIVGPNREVYVVGGPEQDNDSYVTEIQVPVEAIAH